MQANKGMWMSLVSCHSKKTIFNSDINSKMKNKIFDPD